MDGLELLLKELNPKYDLARHHYDTSFSGMFKDLALVFVHWAKSMARGGIIGGVIGAGLGSLYSLSSGEDVLKGLEYARVYGLGLGATLDLSQYTLRWGWYASKRFEQFDRLAQNLFREKNP